VLWVGNADGMNILNIRITSFTYTTVIP